MNIIECAIKMKEERRNHYRQLAVFAGDTELERLAVLLAEANSELISRLEKLNKSPEVASLTENALSADVCVFSPRFDAKHPEIALSHDSDAYLHVVNEIRDSVEFYNQLEAESDSEPLKVIYRKLSEMEREHLIEVANIYSFVEDPRTYLEWGEFSNLKQL